MNHLRWLFCGIVYAVIAACAAKPAPPPPPAPPAAPTQTVDGEYLGTSTRFRASSRACPHPGLVRITVSGNAFQFRWDQEISVDATIAADGAVNGGAEGITLAGRMSGSKMEADVTNGFCGLHFTVAKHS
jgi:hypothetical protein